MDLKDDIFYDFVKEGIVIVDFWAPWCPPCRALGPIIEEVCKNNNIKLGKVNVDEEIRLANIFKVESIPFVVKFENGKAKKSFVGLKNESFIEDFILH